MINKENLYLGISSSIHKTKINLYLETDDYDQAMEILDILAKLLRNKLDEDELEAPRGEAVE